MTTRWKDPLYRSRRVSKEAPTRARTGRSASVAATDCRNRKVDFPLAVLSCRAESRHLLLFASAARKRKQNNRRFLHPFDCAQGKTFGRNDNEACYGLRRTNSEFVRVGEFAQKRIMARRSEIFDDAAEDRIQKRARVPDVQVKRYELAAKMQLGSVIQWIAVIIFQSLLQRPRDDVPQRIEIKVQIERDSVIEPDTFIVNRVVAHQAKTERDNFAALPPDKEPRPFRHPLSD